MITSKVTSKSQTTIPKKVRDSLNLRPEDIIAYEIEDDHAVIRKVIIPDDDYLNALEGTLGEWGSQEDSAAYDQL